jgi:hypothetical protein
MLTRSTGEIVDGRLRLKAALKIGLTELPVILCDEGTEAQVRAFRLMVNRSVNWVDWDDDLLRAEMTNYASSISSLLKVAARVGGPLRRPRFRLGHGAATMQVAWRVELVPLLQSDGRSSSRRGRSIPEYQSYSRAEGQAASR